MKTDPFLYPRVVLSGMMGSGKTTIGRLVADFLDWEFVDTDKQIERETGKSIKELFAREGEDYFRQLERELVVHLQNHKHIVIASGGGMVLPPANREMLAQDSLFVHLKATIGELEKRLQQVQDRPLLFSGELEQQLRAIYNDREEIYAGLPLQILTDEKSPVQIAQEILFHLMQSHQIIAEQPHKAYVGYNLVSQFKNILGENDITSPLVLLVDADFCQIYGLHWMQQIENQIGDGVKVVLIPLPSHEKSKSIETVIQLWQRFIKAGVERYGCLVIIGGGVLGDVGGFVASTYMRGIKLVHVPTTLLSQIDSSLGGKTGINLKQTKNMVGTFYPAHHILIDPLLLLTLPDREMRSGLAEMIKAALLADALFFEFLEKNISALLNFKVQILLKAVKWAAQIKLKIVQEDLHEQSGRRMLLNLGHSFGHAIEAISDYSLRHGEAVAIGMVLAARFAVRKGFCSNQVLQRLIQLLQQAHLPVEVPDYPFLEIVTKIINDKKRTKQVLQFVVPVAIGKASIIPIQSERELELAFGD